MSSLAWMILIVTLLTLLGSATLLFITIRYYWGDRGKPPLTGEERRRQKLAEIEMRAAQFEISDANPRKVRSLDFWDNTKR